jgi:FtsP/CotA-like multicopper oxidase with cupredoxin domain
MTPPRAGTFMYHVHSEPGHQLAQGLYSAFLVMEPGERWEPDTDRLFMLGSLGAELDAPPAVNGTLDPEPIELRSGATYRFRFMHISPDDQKRVQLSARAAGAAATVGSAATVREAGEAGGDPIQWRLVAKDGADLPPALARTMPADFRIDVGETYDFVWTPQRTGALTLRIVTTFIGGAPGFPSGAPQPHTMEIPVRVR